MSPRTSLVGAALVMMATMSLLEPIDESQDTGPGKASKGIVRDRLEVEPTEHTTPKRKSDSLKRLLRK